jgi:hypothetical protein
MQELWMDDECSSKRHELADIKYAKSESLAFWGCSLQQPFSVLSGRHFVPNVSSKHGGLFRPELCVLNHRLTSPS